MTGEERNIQAKLILSGDIRNRYQMIHRLFGNGVRVWLEVIPEQEQADDIHSDLANHAKLFTHFASVKVGPPVHGFSTGPIVHPKGKIGHLKSPVGKGLVNRKTDCRSY